MTSKGRHVLRCSVALILILCGLTLHLDAQIDREESGEGIAVIVPIEGELTTKMIRLIERGVDDARRLGAKALVLEIDSPGGQVTIMEEMDKALHQIDEDGIETIALVLESANSAAAFLAMGCDKLYMVPGSQIGSATPIQFDPFGGLPDIVGGPDDQVREKFLSAFRAKFRTQAESQGRNVSIAEAMVDSDIELVLVEIDGKEDVIRRFDLEQMKDPPEVLEVISPRGNLVNMTADESIALRFSDGIVTSRKELVSVLDIADDGFREVESTWSEDLAGFFDSIGWILLFAGCVLIYIEFNVPGFGIPGILGASCIALMLFGKYAAGLAEIPEILLVVAGLGLLAVELFVFPGTLVAGIVGGLAIFVGVILSFQSFILPNDAYDKAIFGNNILMLSVTSISSVFAMIFIARFLPKTPVLGGMVLDPSKGAQDLKGAAAQIDDVSHDAVAIDTCGEAETDLRPAGRILIGDRSLDAVTEGPFIERGNAVRVVKVEGNRIVVRSV